MFSQKIPYHLLNRYGRRSHAAMARKAAYLDRVWKAREESDRQRHLKRKSVELHLEKVRERTRLRKLSNQ